VRQLTIPHPPATSDAARHRVTAARWLLTFAGFPLGGLAARYLTGPVDSIAAAVLGGVVTGAVLGAVQAWALGTGRRSAFLWAAATAVGLAAGLGLGATSVGFSTSPDALIVQGALCGLAVGAAQALVLRASAASGSPTVLLAWPPALAVIWAIGWVPTIAVGVRVGEQFTVFGSSGALVVTALTLVLPLVIATGRLDGRLDGRLTGRLGHRSAERAS
jgi:hypothetical protein